MTADGTANRPLLSVAQAARLLGISVRTAYEWAARRELPGLVEHGGRRYVRRAILVAYIHGADVITEPSAPPTDLGQARRGA